MIPPVFSDTVERCVTKAVVDVRQWTVVGRNGEQ